MLETKDELDGLQALLDASLSRSTAHLRSIITPASTLTAEQLTRVLTGMCVLSVATVTAGGEPRVSAVDGFFRHGAWYFGTSRTAAKARHLAARPSASLSHLRGEELGVFAHGTAVALNPSGAQPDAEWGPLHEDLTRHYGESPQNWGDVVYFRIRPRWMTVYGSPEKLLPAAAEKDG